MELGVDHIPSKLIQAGGGKLYEEIHKLIVLIWNKEELPQEWKESIIVPIHNDIHNLDESLSLIKFQLEIQGHLPIFKMP